MTYPHSSLLGILLRMCTRNLVQRHNKCRHSCRDWAHIDSWLKHQWWWVSYVAETAHKLLRDIRKYLRKYLRYFKTAATMIKFSITPFAFEAIMITNFASHNPSIRLAGRKFELTNQDSEGGKKFSVLTSMYVDRKGIEIRNLFSLEMAWNIFERGFTIPKPFHIAQSEKYETSCVSKLLIWCEIVVRRAWPCRIIIALFFNKMCCSSSN